MTTQAPFFFPSEPPQPAGSVSNATAVPTTAPPDTKRHSYVAVGSRHSRVALVAVGDSGNGGQLPQAEGTWRYSNASEVGRGDSGAHCKVRDVSPQDLRVIAVILWAKLDQNQT